MAQEPSLKLVYKFSKFYRFVMALQWKGLKYVKNVFSLPILDKCSEFMIFLIVNL